MTPVVTNGVLTERKQIKFMITPKGKELSNKVGNGSFHIGLSLMTPTVKYSVKFAELSMVHSPIRKIQTNTRNGHMAHLWLGLPT